MANFAVEEYELFGDPKYRSYVSAIDKVLKNFESTSEWADLISALGKLNKVLLSHIKQPVIPRRIIISKRLAQCMHPALPGGVHLKALETYDIIFKCIKTNRLSQELFIYSAGLFPLLSYAATNVRQALLKIYEIHFVPLEKKLRPGLPGFLIGVLPGLEEGAEYYERTNTLLENVSSGVGEDYFFGCLWECVLANTTIRLPAITYVYTHFNRKVNIEDQLYIMGTNVDVMVKALCSAVQDNNVLVQRSTLDFLLVTFPMHSDHLIRSDMVKLLSSAVCVVLRRDMSLNRRLYSWLLSNDSNTSERMCQNVGELSPPPGRESLSSDSDVSNYFDIYSRSVLIQALCNCLKNNE